MGQYGRRSVQYGLQGMHLHPGGIRTIGYDIGTAFSTLTHCSGCPVGRDYTRDERKFKKMSTAGNGCEVNAKEKTGCLKKAGPRQEVTTLVLSRRNCTEAPSVWLIYTTACHGSQERLHFFSYFFSMNNSDRKLSVIIHEFLSHLSGESLTEALDSFDQGRQKRRS